MSMSITWWNRPTSLALLGALVIALAAPIASSQGPSSIAEENEQLKARVTELESQLEMARARIAALNDEVERLRNLLADAKRSGGSSGATPARDRSADPMASPSILFDHLKNTYAESMGGMALDTRTDHLRYKRKVSAWVREMQRSLKGSVNWTIRVVDGSQATARQPMISFEVVDPTTGKAVGDPSSCVFPSRFARMIDTNSAQELWRLQGQLSAMPAINNRRQKEGDDTDAAKFIGPFAEFGFELAIRTFEPAP